MLGVLLVALLAALPVTPALGPHPLAAVLELRNKLHGPDRDAVDAAYLTDLVRTAALHEMPALRLMTRENVLVLLEQSGRKIEECEGECEVDTGRRLGADLVISGEVLRFGEGFRLSLRLHSTAHGELVNGAQANGRSADELEGAVRATTSQLLTPLTGAVPAIPPSRRRSDFPIPQEAWQARGPWEWVMGLDAVALDLIGFGSLPGAPWPTSCRGGGASLTAGVQRFFLPDNGSGRPLAVDLGLQVEGGYMNLRGGGPFVVVGPQLGGGVGLGSFEAGDEWSGAMVGLHWAPAIAAFPNVGVQFLPLGVDLTFGFYRVHPEQESHLRFTMSFRSEIDGSAKLLGGSVGWAWY